MPAGFHPSITHLYQCLCSLHSKPYILHASTRCIQPWPSEGYCWLFLSLWPLGYVVVFEYISPLTLLSSSSGLANKTCQSQGRWLVLLLSTRWFPLTPILYGTRPWGYHFIKERRNTFNSKCLALCTGHHVREFMLDWWKECNTGQIKWDEMSHSLSLVSESCSPSGKQLIFNNIPIFCLSTSSACPLMTPHYMPQSSATIHLIVIWKKADGKMNFTLEY